MIEVSAEVTVEAPVEQVWAVLVDYSRDPQWRAGVQSMTPDPAGPARAGTTTVEILRAAGRTMRNDGVVESVDDHRLQWRTTSGVRARGHRSVHAVGPDACRVELVQRFEPPGVLAAVPWLVRRLQQRTLRGDADRLRRLIGSGGTGPPDPSDQR